MNNKLSYEVLIAGKLEQRLIPDMVDDIWARIEAQLDLDLPTDDGNGGTPPPTPSLPGNLWLVFGLSIFLTALLLAISQKSDDKRAIENATRNPPIDAISPRSPMPSPRDPGIIAPIIPKSIAPIQSPPAGTPVPGDSALVPDVGPQSQSDMIPPVITPKPDSVASNAIAIPTIPKKDSTRKRKGVTGITDDDYRIESKKD